MHTGAGLSWKIAFALAIAIIIASALSVGITEFMSSKAHKEFLLAEKRRELWEFKHYKDGEILEVRKDSLYFADTTFILSLDLLCIIDGESL